MNARSSRPSGPWRHSSDSVQREVFQPLRELWMVFGGAAGLVFVLPRLPHVSGWGFVGLLVAGTTAGVVVGIVLAAVSRRSRFWSSWGMTWGCGLALTFIGMQAGIVFWVGL